MAMNTTARISVTTALVMAATSAHANSLPQMDNTWFANQLVWLAVAFIALYIMVAVFIAPAIHAVLHTRESAINTAIAEAEKARAEAELTQGKATSAGQSARAKAAELMAAVQAENTREATTALAKLDHDLAKKAGHAQAVLDDAVSKAEAGIAEAAQSLAESITAQLLGAQAASSAAAPKLKLAKS